MATINRDGSIDAKFGWWREVAGRSGSADGVSTLPRRRFAHVPDGYALGSKRLGSRSRPPAAGESQANTSSRRSASRCWSPRVVSARNSLKATFPNAGPADRSRRAGHGRPNGLPNAVGTPPGVARLPQAPRLQQRRALRPRPT